MAGEAILSWDPNMEADLAGYKIHYGTAPGSYSQTVDVGLTPSPATPTATVANLLEGTFYFAVTAINISGSESGFSNEVSKAVGVAAETGPLPADVVNFKAEPLGQTIYLSWTNPSDPDFVGVVIRYRTDGTYPTTETDGSPLGDFKSLPDQRMSTAHTGLEGGVLYSYSAFSYNAQGVFSRTAHASATANVAGAAEGGGGGCAMVTPKNGKSGGPGEAAEMVAVAGVIFLMLLRKLAARIRTGFAEVKLS